MNAYQVRASISKWVLDNITLDTTLRNPIDCRADPKKDRVANEWRLYWDEDQESPIADSAYRRIIQIDRLRNDGDVIALEIEMGALFEALGLIKPGVFASVPVYDFPDNRTTEIGFCRVGRMENRGYKMLPDEARRPNQLRAVVSLVADYVIS